MADQQKLPPCGLYRTTQPHPEQPERVGANRLVHFHNHSSSGKPIVLLPDKNAMNVWAFHDRGFAVSDAAWCDTLEALLPEGVYVVGTAMQLGGRTVPDGQLVQLGYNGFGDPILFFPTRAASANALMFPDKGTKIDRAQLELLRPVQLAGARPVGDHVN